jgi:archaellum component FlaF (FlaF/FlaG flagellin family)
MGLSHAAVQVAWGLAIVATAGMAAPAAMEAAAQMRDARDSAEEGRRAEAASALEATRMVYDAIARTLVIEANNTGAVALGLDEQAFLVDGRLYTNATAAVPGKPVTKLWLPGEQASFTLPGVTAAPSRVLVVSARPGADTLASSEGQLDEVALGFELGSGAANSRHFKDMRLSPDASSFTATAKMKSGADTLVKDVLRIRNPGLSARNVTLTASRDSNSYIEAMDWIVRNGTTEVARLRYKDASPSATFTLASGASYTLDFRADFADGTGRNNVNGNFGLRMAAS